MRNPLYVGVILLTICLAPINNPVPGVVLITLIALFLIRLSRREECSRPAGREVSDHQRRDRYADPGSRLDAEQSVRQIAEGAEDEEAEGETVSPPRAAPEPPRGARAGRADGRHQQKGP